MNVSQTLTFSLIPAIIFVSFKHFILYHKGQLTKKTNNKTKKKPHYAKPAKSDATLHKWQASTTYKYQKT